MLTIVVLPEPDGPNSAVTPLAAPKHAASAKVPRRFSTSTASTITPPGNACRRGVQDDSEAMRAASAMTIAISTRRPAAASPSGICERVLSAAEIVCVSPGMLETKVIVAPNSPKALAKHKTTPAITPGSASGNVMVRNTSMRLAPSLAGGILKTAVDRL